MSPQRIRPAILAAVAAAALAAFLAGCNSETAPGPGEHVIVVTEKGFEPAVTEVGKGRPVVLLVTRRTDRTCATEMVFAGTDHKWDLPLNQRVRVELPAGLGDTLRYACGMDMFKGMVVVK